MNRFRYHKECLANCYTKYTLIYNGISFKPCNRIQGVNDFVLKYTFPRIYPNMT